jgi:hypothetical protein
MARTQQHPLAQPEHDDDETDDQRRRRAIAEERAVRDAAEQAIAHMPAPGMPQHRLTGTDVAEEGEKMVRMLFLLPVSITLPGYRTVHFPVGMQDVPASIASDPQYQMIFKANGATPTG